MSTCVGSEDDGNTLKLCSDGQLFETGEGPCNFDKHDTLMVYYQSLKQTKVALSSDEVYASRMPP